MQPNATECNQINSSATPGHSDERRCEASGEGTAGEGGGYAKALRRRDLASLARANDWKWNEMERNGTELKVCRSYALLRAVPRRGWLPRLRVAAVPSVVPVKTETLHPCPAQTTPRPRTLRTASDSQRRQLPPAANFRLRAEVRGSPMLQQSPGDVQRHACNPVTHGRRGSGKLWRGRLLALVRSGGQVEHEWYSRRSLSPCG